MALYQTKAVLLKPVQKELLMKSVQERTGAILRLPQYSVLDPDLGSDGVPMPLTQRQINKSQKHDQKGRGFDLKLSKHQLHRMKKDQGVGKLMGLEGEGIGRTLKHIGKHALKVTGRVAKHLEPIATNIAGQVLEKKLKEQLGLGVKKKLKRTP